MTPNRRILLNIVATYGRSLHAFAIGQFTARWVLMSLCQVDYGLVDVVGGLTAFVSFLNSLMAGVVGHLPAERNICYNTRNISSLNEPWCESPRRYGVEESLAHIFYLRRVA